MSKQYYKFLYNKKGKLMSEHGRKSWIVGKEYSVRGKIVKCKNGFHASEQPLDALKYVKGDVLALVEVSGDCDKDKYKVCYRTMKIVKAYEWTKSDSVTIAIYCAEQVLKFYEERYPNDSRPRDAIKAAKAYLKNPNKKNAASAAAAYSAAASASSSAASSAAASYSYAASEAASAAAASSAYSASSAASYASAAASYASGVNQKINRKIKAQIKKLNEVKL